MEESSNKSDCVYCVKMCVFYNAGGGGGGGLCVSVCLELKLLSHAWRGVNKTSRPRQRRIRRKVTVHVLHTRGQINYFPPTNTHMHTHICRHTHRLAHNL